MPSRNRFCGLISHRTSARLFLWMKLPTPGFGHVRARSGERGVLVDDEDEYNSRTKVELWRSARTTIWCCRSATAVQGLRRSCSSSSESPYQSSKGCAGGGLGLFLVVNVEQQARWRHCYRREPQEARSDGADRAASLSTLAIGGGLTPERSLIVVEDDAGFCLRISSGTPVREIATTTSVGRGVDR